MRCFGAQLEKERWPTVDDLRAGKGLTVVSSSVDIYHHRALLSVFPAALQHMLLFMWI